MSTRTFAGVCAVAAILALPLSSLAQKPTELTALDYIQIQQLVAKYARAIDTCSNNGYDYADLYTPDGVFLPDGERKDDPGIQGREKLAEVSGGGSKGCKNVPLDRAGRASPLREPHHHADAGRGEGHRGHVDDRLGRRPEQDRERRVLRGHLREDGAGLALQAAHASRVAGRGTPADAWVPRRAQATRSRACAAREPSLALHFRHDDVEVQRGRASAGRKS